MRPGRHEFFANHAGAESKFAITVGFAREPSDESTLDSLLLHRGRGEDNVPGIAGVCVEIPIQQHVVCGGIVEAVLEPRRFAIRFDQVVTAELAGFREIVIHFDLPEETFTAIRQALRMVFASCSCYRELLAPPA